MLPQESITVPTRAGQVAVTLRGDGPPFVLLHANGHDHHDFDALVEALGDRFRTVAIDWPGMGDSPLPDAPAQATTARFCDALEDVVTALALPPAIFLGNSIGGTAATRLAARHPERVRALVLVNTGGFTPRGATMRAFCWLSGRVTFRRAMGLAWPRFYLKRRTPLIDELLRRYAASHRDPRSHVVEAALWRSFARPENDLTAEAARITCPTLLVWGTRDPVLRARVDGRRARAHIPHAQWIALETGHSPFVEDPDAFAAALAPFLAGLTTRVAQAR